MVTCSSVNQHEWGWTYLLIGSFAWIRAALCYASEQV